MNEEVQIAVTIIRRDFDLEETLSSDEDISAMRELLIDKINFLLDHDFEKLLSILYRIDVSEQRAKASLAEKSDQSPGKVLADLIIDRQIEKAKTRMKYRTDRREE